MATHSSILAWRIPRTKEPDGLQPMESQRIGHDSETNTLNFETYMRRQKICTLKTIRHWLKKLKMITNRKIYCVLGLKKSLVSKWLYQCGDLEIWCNCYQITNDIFHRIRTKILTFLWRHKRLWIAKVILRKKNDSEGIRFPAFRLFVKLQ